MAAKHPLPGSPGERALQRAHGTERRATKGGDHFGVRDLPRPWREE